MKRFAVALLMASSVSSAWANEYQPAMQAYFETEVMTWIQSEAIIAAIRAQNEAHAGIDQARIDSLDQAWRAEVGSGSQPLVDSVLTNASSEYLRAQVDAAGGVISEVFVMDFVGLNVAASDATSDYWQGDEPKFQETYGAGVGAMHFGEVEFDESSQTYQGQVSAVIVDPESNEPIGAITVGLNAEALM